MTKQKHHIAKLLVMGLVLASGLAFAFPSTATNAATLTVDMELDETIDDENTDNSSCSLTEAIENINDQAQTNTDCNETGTYGTDDTITLPAGTITLTADLPQITESLTIQGQGMDTTTIDGDGAWEAIEAGSLVGSDFTLTGIMDFGIFANGATNIERIEIDGNNWGYSGGGIAGGILLTNNSSDDIESLASDIYVHNFDIDAPQILGLGLGGGPTNSVSGSATDITISDMTNTGNILPLMVTAGLFDGGASIGSVDAEIGNASVSNITSTDGIVAGVILAGATQDELTINANVENSTFVNLRGEGTNLFLDDLNNGAVIASAAASVNSMTNNLTTSNLLIAGNNMDSCATGNINSAYGYSGTVTNNITSSGGNLSDDNSCSSYFNQATDQNNVSGLAGSLAPLSDNGGYVPTMALLEGSPAIDSGITVAGLTTDARGELRPQGNAYDSGAYESPFTAPEDQDTDGETLAETGDVQWVYGLIGVGLVLVAAITTRKFIKA